MVNMNTGASSRIEEEGRSIRLMGVGVCVGGVRGDVNQKT